MEKAYAGDSTLPTDLELRNKHKVALISSYVECRDRNKDMKVDEGQLGNRKENRKMRL